MRRYNNTVQTATGQAISGAVVIVTQASQPPGTGLGATLFSDDGLTQIPNTVIADVLGRFAFFAPDGKYDLTITGGTPAVTVPYVLAAESIQDLLEFNTLDAQPIAVQTLNLTGLASGPTPPTGTVNLYSKLVDGRLYYKDSTGVEVGPLVTSGGGTGETIIGYSASHTLVANEAAVVALANLTFTVDASLNGQAWDIFSDTGTTTITAINGTLHGNGSTGSFVLPNNRGVRLVVRSGNAYALGL